MVSAISLTIVGFFLLIKGAVWLVDGASSLAGKLKITQAVIGLTVVSFGTSTPELFVNVFASINNKADIAVGNILGSNIANILLVLGISTIIYPLVFRKSLVWKEVPLSLLAVVIFTLLAIGGLVDNSFLGLDRVDGLILIALFSLFIHHLLVLNKDQREKPEEEPASHSLPKSLLLVLLGLVGLVLGGQWIVNSAVAIASTLGVSEAVIALTLIAVGTSLPELATSAVAAYKKKADIAVGNIIGSNIFNIFWVLGVSAAINPLPFSPTLFIDAGIIVLATILLFVFMFIGEKYTLKRWQGVILVLLYAVYVVSLTLR